MTGSRLTDYRAPNPCATAMPPSALARLGNVRDGSALFYLAVENIM